MWLHVPKTSSASAAEGVGSISESTSLYLALEQSATWKTKSMRPESWRKALQKADWTTRLSGLTYEPSTANRGAASWIASLADSLASPTVSQESAKASTTSATSGLTSPDWYTNFHQAAVSSRTFQASLSSTGPTSDPTYKPWVTRLRKESLARREWARRIFASGSLSWPTARAEDAEQTGSHRGRPDSLKAAMRAWQTPNASGYKSHQSGDATRTYAMLPKQAENWQTPTARHADSPAEENRKSPRIAHQAAKWQTPKTPGGGNSSRSGDRIDELLLVGQAKHWRTPDAVQRGGPALVESRQGHQVNLQDQTLSWATPAARDYKDGGNPSPNVPTNGLLGRQAPRTPMAGQDTSNETLVLNPRFVEALMGWPIGMTDFESSETAWSQWRQQMLGLLWMLC
jgi:hypothetical protein